MRGRRALLAAILLFPDAARAASGAAVADEAEVTLPAGPPGRLRWAAWTERDRAGRAVVLALRRPGRAGGEIWRGTWRDAYGPGLRAVPGWRHRGRPLVALTLRYGAAAQEVLLLARDGANPPRRVAARLASALEWRADSRGRPLLVAYDRDGSALVPRSLDWDGRALVPAARGRLSGP